MARDRNADTNFAGPVRRLMLAVLILVLGGLFLVWRIDSPRIERLRAAFVDAVVPNFDWALVPVTKFTGMIDDFQSYASLYEQNQQLRDELQQMRAWKEAAVQLEQQNAKLLAQNSLRLDPKLTSVSGVVLADSGSPFRQSVLLNVGARDGIVDGWATTDGLGLVGRISGVGNTTSRVLLLTDPSSRVPVAVQPSGQRAILSGDNSGRPILEFVEDADKVRAGDRVVSSGDGGVFPAGLLVGQAALDTEGRLRVILAADYERLEIMRVLRSRPAEAITDAGDLILPAFPPIVPETPAVPSELEAATPAAAGLQPDG